MGAITSSSVAALGSGYSGGDILTVPGGGANALVVINFVDGSGVPTSYVLPDQGFTTAGVRGCGYRVANNIVCSGGSGTGFKLNILSVGPGTDATHGNIGGTSVASGGSGYTVNDTGYIIQGTNTSGVYGQIGIGVGGAVTFFDIDPADGYKVGLATTTPGGPFPGSGSGFTINITSISPCGGALSGYRNRFYVMK